MTWSSIRQRSGWFMLWAMVVSSFLSALPAVADEVHTADGRRLVLQEYPLPAGAYPHDAVPDHSGRGSSSGRPLRGSRRTCLICPLTASKPPPPSSE